MTVTLHWGHLAALVYVAIVLVAAWQAERLLGWMLSKIGTEVDRETWVRVVNEQPRG